MYGDFILKLARLISENPDFTIDGNPICEADADMRDLERRAKMGDKEAAAELSRMRRRSGKLPTVEYLLDQYSQLVGDKPENFNKYTEESDDAGRFEKYLEARPGILFTIENSLSGIGYKRQILRKIARRVAKIWETLEYAYGHDKSPPVGGEQLEEPGAYGRYMREALPQIKRMRKELANILEFKRPWENLGPRTPGLPGHLSRAYEHLFGEEPLSGYRPLASMAAAMGEPGENPQFWTWFNYDTGEVHAFEAVNEADMMNQAADLGMELGEEGEGWDFVLGDDLPPNFTPQGQEDGWN